MADVPALLRIPPEIRLIIYEHLLDTGGCGSISLQSQARHLSIQKKLEAQRRTSYHVLDRSFMRASYQTTYCLSTPAKIHPAILGVNRRIGKEAAYFLYGTHNFQFISDLEAVLPFLHDLTIPTRGLIQEITLRKRGSVCIIESESPAWGFVCQNLCMLPNLRKLKVIIEGGCPRHEWQGPQTLILSDLRLLYSTHHESLQWVRELASVKGLERLEIVTDMQHMPQPKTTSSLIFAALSASIETSLVEFLKTDLGMPATSLGS